MIPNYSTTLLWSDEDAGYVATSSELPGLSGVAANPVDAMRELREAMEMAVEALRDAHKPLPQPRVMTAFSGQLRLRLPRSLHAEAAAIAEHEDVSLNTLLLALIAEGLARRSAAHRDKRLGSGAPKRAIR